MKVMLLNGSPHEKGCTYTALEEVQRELKKCGVDSGGTLRVRRRGGPYRRKAG